MKRVEGGPGNLIIHDFSCNMTSLVTCTITFTLAKLGSGHRQELIKFSIHC